MKEGQPAVRLAGQSCLEEPHRLTEPAKLALAELKQGKHVRILGIASNHGPRAMSLWGDRF